MGMGNGNIKEGLWEMSALTLLLSRDSWREVFDFLTLFDIGRMEFAMTSNKRQRELTRSILFNYNMKDEDSTVMHSASEWFVWIRKYSVCVRHVHIGDDSYVNDDDIIAFANHTGQTLRSFFFHVNVYDAPDQSSDRSIIHLAQACPNLCHCQFTPAMTDAGLHALAVHCTGLNFREISGMLSDITADGFLAFQRCRPKVERFQMMIENRNSPIFLGYLSSDEIIEWIRISCSPEITKHVYVDMTGLDADFEYFEGKFNAFNDRVLIALVNQCPHIESIYIKAKSNSLITNRGIRHLANNCKSLVDLSLIVLENQSIKLDIGSIIECLSKCPIEILSLSGFEYMICDETLYGFPDFPVFTKIKRLSFDCRETEFSNSGMSRIAEKFPNVKELNISTLGLGGCLPFVTDQGIEIVLQECRLMEKLRIHNCAIDEERFEQICSNDTDRENSRLTETKIQLARGFLDRVEQYSLQYSHLRDYYDKNTEHFHFASVEWRKNRSDGCTFQAFVDEAEGRDYCIPFVDKRIWFDEDDEEGEDDEDD